MHTTAPDALSGGKAIDAADMRAAATATKGRKRPAADSPAEPRPHSAKRRPTRRVSDIPSSPSQDAAVEAPADEADANAAALQQQGRGRKRAATDSIPAEQVEREQPPKASKRRRANTADATDSAVAYDEEPSTVATRQQTVAEVAAAGTTSVPRPHATPAEGPDSQHPWRGRKRKQSQAGGEVVTPQQTAIWPNGRGVNGESTRSWLRAVASGIAVCSSDADSRVAQAAARDVCSCCAG